MQALEEPLYNVMLEKILPADDLKFINNILQGKNTIKAKHGILAKVFATRMSGEMNTSLGNGWANYVVFRTIVEMKNGRFEGFVEGDDGIFACSVDITTEDYAMLGFDVKVIDHDSAATASFCGIISACDGTLIKDPHRFFTNFGWTHSMIQAGDTIMNELLRAKALSAAYEVPQCPIVGAMARYALKITRGYEPRFIEDGYHDTTLIPRDEKTIKPYSPTPNSRTLFSELFGVSSAQQIQAERLIMSGQTSHLSKLFPPNEATLMYTSRYVAAG